MMGTKRRNVSLRSDAEDTAFQSKRISGDDSRFQSQGLESSQNQVGAAPSLDLQRAVSSQQHVRALNTQFASWVQSQLQNHPDELWEDGVRDYLTHASNILEKFSDVVSWLKAKTANGEMLPSLKAGPGEKPQDKETNNNAETARREKPMFAAESKFAPSWNSTVLSNSQTPAQSKSLLSPWTSGGTTQGQSPSSNSNASLEASINSQAVGLSTAPVFTPWSSGVFSKSLLPSSGTNSSEGASSNSQVAAQGTTPITTPWTSGVFSKNQSPSSGVFSKNQSPSSGVFSTNQSPSSGVFSTNQPPSSGVFSANQSPSSGVFSTNQPPSSGVFSTNQPPSFGVFSTNQPPSSGIFSTNQSPSSGTSASAPVAAAASWSFGLSSNNQASLKFGSQSTAPSSDGAATNDNADDENEEQPSSPSLKKSEEKGIVVVHEVKCKLYLKSSDPADKDPWKDKGTGQLSIKCKEGVSKGAKESKPTILVRNDVGRILLNALLYPGIKTTSVKSNSIMAIFHTAVEDGINGNNSEVVARTFLIKTKNEAERNKLAEAIQENAPAA